MQSTANNAAASASASLASVLALPSTRSALEQLMVEYQEAEVNYTKASSHTNAEYCGRKAQLVALQLAYISRTTTETTSVITSSGLTVTGSNSSSSIPLILNLEGGHQVREFIHNCGSFFEVRFYFLIFYILTVFYLF